MTIVVDASCVVAALVAPGPDGAWATSQLERDDIAAPHLLLVEAASVLRKAVAAGDVSSDAGALAHADLVALRVELFPYAPFASRVWELRPTVSTYDAWYVAVAEELDAPLATLDGRLRRASGPRCTFRLPPSATKPTG